MMRIVSSVGLSAVFFSASNNNIVASELRGTVSATSSSQDDKPTIGIYANGGDEYTRALITSALPPLFTKDCAVSFNWDVTHYGMTTEKDGKFYSEERFGGEQNIEYLKAINCLQSMTPNNNTDTSMLLAQSLLMFDVIGSTWDGLKMWLDPGVAQKVQKCIDSDKSNTLMHEAGVKTNKAVKFDFSKTKDLAITYNGQQEMNWLTEKTADTWCKWSNNAKACCDFTPNDDVSNTTSSFPSAEHLKIFQEAIQHLSQTINDAKSTE